MEEERERGRELEIAVEDKEEQVRIVEKKSNGLVGTGTCTYTGEKDSNGTHKANA